MSHVYFVGALGSEVAWFIETVFLKQRGTWWHGALSARTTRKAGEFFFLTKSQALLKLTWLVAYNQNEAECRVSARRE